MNLTRKDFLLRAGVAALPASLAGAALVARGQSAAPGPALSQFNVRLFGAKGDGQAKDTKAIQSAIDTAGVTGGTVWFPPGKYLSGTVRFKSHVTVFLDAGATLIFSPDRDDFDPLEKLDFKPPLANDFSEAASAFQVGPEVGKAALRQEGNLLRR